MGNKYGYYKHAANARLLIANAYVNSGRYDSAFDYLRTAKEWAEKLKQPEHLPKIDEIYAYLYNILGDEKKAISYGLEAVEGYEKSDIWEINIQSVYAWIEIGRIFERQQQYDKALYYYNKALDKGQRFGQGHYWYTKAPMINVANVYFKQNRLAEAAQLYNQVVEMDTSDIDVDNTASALNGVGRAKIQQHKYTEAVSSFKRSLVFCVANNLQTSIDECYCGIGYAFLLNGQYDSAALYLQRGLRQSIITNDINTLDEAYKYLALLHETRGDFKQALVFERLHKTTADSIYNRAKVAVLNNLEVLYQTNQKEKQIITLQANNTEKQLQLVKHSRLLFITGVIICLLIIVVLFFYYQSRQKQFIAKHQQLIHQKKITAMEQQQKMVALQNLVAGQETERTRIARDLHDGLGGLFATVKMHLSSLKHTHTALADDELLNRSNELVDSAAEELRSIAHNLMPEVLVKLGLIQALTDFCHNINAEEHLQVSLQAYGFTERLPPETEVVIYRIVQELVTNILKHAQATQAIVQFNRDGNTLHLVVEDNGRGFNPNAAETKPHAGLGNIKTRVSFLNGTMAIDSRVGAGTTVTMEFTLQQNKAA